MSVVLDAETPYLLVPSTADPGHDALFELRVLSAVPMELMPLPKVRQGNLLQV